MISGAAPILAALIAALPLGDQEGQTRTAIERELGVRRQALDPVGMIEEIRRGLASERWWERDAALDALARAGRAETAGPELEPRLAEAIEEALGDPHPNVADRALEALAALEWSVELDEAAVERFLESPLPSSRVLLARWLEKQPSERAVPLLLDLRADPDQRVRKEVLRSLLGQGEAAAPAWRRILAEADASAGRETVIHLLQAFERAQVGEAVLATLRDWAARMDGDTRVPRADRAGWRALVEALGLRLAGRGDPSILAAGWTTEGPRDSLRPGMLLRAAQRGGEPLARALLETLREEELRRESAPPDLPSADRAAADRRLDQRRLALVDGAAEALEPAALVALADRLELHPDSVVLLWEGARSRAASWGDPWVATLLEPGRDRDLRLTVVETLSFALSHAGDPGAGEHLVLALGDADRGIAEVAFRSLCDAPEHWTWLPALHREWIELLERSPAVAIARLAWFSRDLPMPPFRGDFLALGEREREQRGSVAELLGAFVGDPEVVETLGRWLREEALAIAGPGVEGKGPALARSIPLIRALHRAGGEGEGAVEPLVEFLERAGAEGLVDPAAVGNGRSDPGKYAVAALARTGGGRAELPRLFADGGLRRRLRIEAALNLAPESPEAAAYLRERFDGCHPELRGRILGALGGCAGEAERGFLREVAIGAVGEADRLSAVLALAEDVPGLDQVGDLRAVLRAAPQLETAAIAFETLAGLRFEDAGDLLLEMLALIERGEPLSDPELFAAAGGPARVAREAALRQIVLGALGARGRFGEEVLAAFLRRPLEAAPLELEERFRGERIAARQFSYAGELALAEALRREGELERALDRHRERWPLLDSWLLWKFAGDVAPEAAPEAREVRRRLLQAARIALEGEGRGPEWSARYFEVRAALVALAEERGEWAGVARQARELRLDQAVLRVPARGWRTRMGIYDARAGVDPEARLHSLELQARAWRALEGGELDGARRWAQRAGRALGVSRSAAEAQALLEEALAVPR